MADQTGRTLTGRTVLVADDEPHLTQILAYNLGRAGATVVTARNGAEALAAARRMAAEGRRPDLLITDYQMPVLNGCDLCRALKADPATADLPALMLTARGHKLSPAELGVTTVRRLMSKPFSTADLLGQVLALLPAPSPAARVAPVTHPPAMTPTPPPPVTVPPAFFDAFRRRCADVGVAAWWFDAAGRVVEGPAGVAVSPAVRRAVEHPAPPEGRPALPADRHLVTLPDDAGRTVALIPPCPVAGPVATAALAQLVADLHADLAKADADGHTLDAFSAGLSQSYEEVTFLFRLARLLNAPDDPPAAVDALCRQLLDVVPFGWITLYFRPVGVVLPELRGRSLSAGRPPCPPVDLVDAAVRCCAGTDTFARPRVLAPGQDSLALATGGEVLAVPVAHDRQCVAVLLAGNRHALDPEVTSGDMKFLGAVADLLGVFHENMCRFAEQRAMSLGTVRALANAIDAKDAYTRGHSERVALLAAQLAAATGADPATVERYRISGLIHDVGKIGVPESVLCKAGKLSDDEFALIKRHPTIGVTILQDVPALTDVMAGVLHHHERYDGRGYPRGLKGLDIPLIARCLALADTFDAMSSNRSYRAALPRAQVLAEIANNAGAQFDPALAATFVTLDFTLFDDMLAAARGPAAANPFPAVAA